MESRRKYYKKLPVSVSIGGNLDDDLKEERFYLSDYIMTELWNGFKDRLKRAKDKSDVMTTRRFYQRSRPFIEKMRRAVPLNPGFHRYTLGSGGTRFPQNLVWWHIPTSASEEKEEQP